MEIDRTNVPRNVLIFAGSAVWVFLLLALASFSPTDWPSHAVSPYPPTANLCGSAGAFIAYYLFLFAGQGVFPVLFFTGVVLVLYIFDNPVSDLWMRAAGLLLLTVAFAAAVHHFRPGTVNGLPEGQGGIIGIASAHFLQGYFNTVGTRLILATTLLIGLLLAADDLVLRTPGAVSAAYTAVKERTPQINWNFIPIPTLPSLPKFVTKDAVMERMAALTVAAKRKRNAGEDDDAEEEARPAKTSKKSDKAAAAAAIAAAGNSKKDKPAAAVANQAVAEVARATTRTKRTKTRSSLNTTTTSRSPRRPPWTPRSSTTPTRPRPRPPSSPHRSRSRPRRRTTTTPRSLTSPP